MTHIHSDLIGTTVIVPVYNEEHSIARILESLLAILKTVCKDYEVIVVNDGSTDNSSAIVSSYPVLLVEHSQNMGYGRAIKTGVKAARYDKIIFFDADGEHCAEDIPQMVEQLAHYDGVIGLRRTRDTKTFYRIIGKFFIRLFAYIVLGFYISDLNCGFRGFRRKVITRYLHLLPNGFSASMTSTLIMFFRKYNVYFLPVKIAKRKGSKLKEIRDGRKALVQILRISMVFVPWRIFGSCGVIMILVGCFYGVFVFLKTNSFPASAVMVISTGFASIFCGLIMDQIAEMRKERFED